MDTNNTYTAYHATDTSNTESIVKKGFRFVQNDEHWLGDGAYFFFDKGLAQKWGTNTPTGIYGRIDDPAILEVIISVAKDRTVDMRFLEDYNRVKEAFDDYWKQFISLHSDLKNCSYKKLRCAFFNALIKKGNFQCLISYFSERNNLSVFTQYGKLFNELKTPYIETQICVPDVSVITSISVLE